jgi:hypothetical protein
MTSTPTGASATDEGRCDFDSVFGRWQVYNRRLADITDPDCTTWVEFGATSYAEPILGGLGHIDRIWTDAARWPTTGGFYAAALRPRRPLVAHMVGRQQQARPPRSPG